MNYTDLSEKPDFKTVLKYYGVPFKTICQQCPFPRHDDKNPSHRHWPEGTGYFCTCSYGDSFNFIAYMEEILEPGERFEDHPGTFKMVQEISKTIFEQEQEDII